MCDVQSSGKNNNKQLLSDSCVAVALAMSCGVTVMLQELSHCLHSSIVCAAWWDMMCLSIRLV